MNKDYTYVDGKVIIRDENGRQVLREYYDNLDDVLIQENLIETMEARIAKLEKESKILQKDNRKHWIPMFFPTAIFISTIGTYIMTYFITGTNPFMISMDTIFGATNYAVFFSSVFATFFIPFGVLLDFIMYRDHKDSLKKEKGVNSELEFLKKQIVKEKEKLENLKKEKKRDAEDKKFRVVAVDDKQQLKAFRSHSNLIYDLGYNGEKYFKYLQQGKLDKKLEKYYNDTGIEIAKEYLEEKGPTLARRKK